MKRATVFVCLVGFPVGMLGAGLLSLTDHFDSYQSVRVAQMYPEVVEQAQALDLFLDRLVPRTLTEVELVLGRPTGSTPDSTYAMPLCQPRWVGFGGLGQRQSWVHGEFYPIDGIGGLQVWYHRDSTKVATSVVFLKVDSLFMPYNRQTQNDLGTRLSWDQVHLDDLEQALGRMFGKPVPPNPVLRPPTPRQGHR